MIEIQIKTYKINIIKYQSLIKHLIVTEDLSSLGIAEYDRIILNSTTNEIVYMNGVTYEVVPHSYIYNETDKKYYQKLVAYGKPVEIDNIDLNNEWISDTTDDEYNYFKSDTYEVDPPFSQCKVTWSNLTSITFKYMSNSDKGVLFVLKMDSEKFTDQSSEDDIYLTTEDKASGTYNEFTIECDESEHHIWFGYVKMEGTTNEDRGFIGVQKYVSPVIDVKQGSELPMEYKSGGISAEGGKTYDINFNSVTLPNGSNIVPSYDDYTKTEKVINYEYVDLGLPSDLKWATCNVGASSETESGVYFQWGETSGVSESLVGKYSDENYSWATYKHCEGTRNTLTKYNINNGYGTVDNKTTIESVDDAATQIMGDGWRMPTSNDIGELLTNTTQNQVGNYNGTGVDGYEFTSQINGNSIFIPTAGYAYYGAVHQVDDLYTGNVWSSSPDNENDMTSNPYGAWALHLGSERSCGISHPDRCHGLSVRGVRK